MWMSKSQGVTTLCITADRLYTNTTYKCTQTLKSDNFLKNGAKRSLMGNTVDFKGKKGHPVKTWNSVKY